MRKALSGFWQDKREYCVFALIFCLGLAAYFPGLTAGFQLDDYPMIVDNPLIKHINLDLLWKSNPDRFLTNLSFAWNYRWFELDAISWHVINLLIHITNAFLVWFLTRQIFSVPRIKTTFSPQRIEAASLVVALLYLLHPLQTQAVFYVVQRSMLLSSFFYFLTLIFYFRARLTNDDRFHGYALVCAFLGATTKELLMTLPVVIVLCEVCLFGIQRHTSLRKIGIFLLYNVPLVVIAVFFWGTGQLLSAATSGYAVASFGARLLTEIRVLLTYLRLFFYPEGLTLDYDYPLAGGWHDSAVVAACIVWMVLIAASVMLFRKSPLPMFGVFLFLVLLSPVVFFPFEDLIFEHWMYLPIYGLLIATTALIIQYVRRGWVLGVLTAGLLIAMFFLTNDRSKVWGDPQALLGETIARSPHKARPYHNFGSFYLRENKLEMAERYFLKALALDPRYYQAYNNLGLVYLQKGDYDRAIAILQKVISLAPNYTDAYLNLAAAHIEINQDDLALEQLQRARPLSALHPAIYLGLGNLYWKNGNIPQAFEQFNTALWLNPSSPVVHFNLGNLHYSLGNFYEALTHYEAAVKFDPHFAEAYNNIGHLQFYFRDYAAAAENFRRAIRFGPASAGAYLNLANSLYELGKVDESRKVAQKAVDLYQRKGDTARAQTIARQLGLLVK